MAEQGYDDWLQGFRREVDEALSSSGPQSAASKGPDLEAPPSKQAAAAMKKAVDGFERWWQGETDFPGEPDPGGESDEINRELELSRREARSMSVELERLRADPSAPAQRETAEERRRSANERASLSSRASELETDNTALRRRETDALERLAALKIDFDRMRDEFEGRCGRMAQALAEAQERAKTATEDRQFLQSEFKRQAERLELLEAAAADARETAEARAETGRALSARLDAERVHVAELERRLSELGGTAEALRAQGQALQERLVRVAAPDPEERARLGLDELKKREAALTASFEERQRLLESRMREATVWLETKLKEAGP
ncbi:MAG: hypothetical protein HYZ75_01590 [Elusimicrobia bacterium]|nr:hypothetical protein [Elusimicrobiota bacterium]